MRMTARFASAFVLVAVVGMTSEAFAADKVFDKRFTVMPGGTLTVDTDMGAIIVTGGEGHDVIVHATASGPESRLRDFEMSADVDNHGVTVHGRRSNDWWLDLSWLFGGGMHARFEIQVPRDYQLELSTAGGAIEAQNIKGNVRGHTSGGHLKLESINGQIDVSTSGGAIQAQQLAGATHLRTSGGSVSIRDSVGDLEVRTSGGSVHLENIDGAVDARTSGGSMELSLRGANRGATLRTSGGSIRISLPKDIKATIDAHTSGGGVHCDLPVLSRRDEDRSRNELYGDINGGGPVVAARTSGGSISIRSLN